MKIRVSSVVVVAVIAAAGLCGWRAWSPSPEKVIRRRLDDLGRMVSFGPNEGPLAKMINSDKVAALFSSDAEVKVDAGTIVQNFTGREAVRRAAQAARSTLSSLQVDFHDVNVFVGPDGLSAEVHLTAVAKLPTEPDSQPCELKLLLRKIGGAWMILRVETVKTLR